MLSSFSFSISSSEYNNKLRTALAAVLVFAGLSIANCHAANVVVNGTNGANGSGGINGGDGGNGQPGGDAMATANTVGDASNSATANGGSGGDGGVGGSTGVAGATGGDGGDGGAGGNATATAIASAPSAVTTATATSQGGQGGDGGIGGSGPAGSGASGQPAPGGNARSDAEVSSSTNAVTGVATATGGLGGSNSGLSGLRGTATASAHSTTIDGFIATARANVTGRNPVASAIAETSGGAIAAMSATSGATNRTSLTTQSVAALGGGFSSSLTGFSAMLRSHGLPTTSEVNSQLSGDPNVTAAYNPPGGHTPLALLAMGLNTTNTMTAIPVLTTTADYSFDVSMLTGGRLMIGLLDPSSAGSGFFTIQFKIQREGATVEDQSFDSLGDAMTYFNDHVLDLGPIQSNVSGTLDLSISLSLIAFDNNTRFGATLLIADFGPSILPGDYNDDGTVNAADYAVWRKFNNTSAVLPNDPNAVPIDVDQYNTWRANFGETGNGSGAFADLPNGAVPEPASWLFLVAAALSSITFRGHRAAI